MHVGNGDTPQNAQSRLIIYLSAMLLSANLAFFIWMARSRFSAIRFFCSSVSSGTAVSLLVSAILSVKERVEVIRRVTPVAVEALAELGKRRATTNKGRSRFHNGCSRRGAKRLIRKAPAPLSRASTPRYRNKKNKRSPSGSL